VPRREGVRVCNEVVQALPQHRSVEPDTDSGAQLLPDVRRRIYLRPLRRRDARARLCSHAVREGARYREGARSEGHCARLREALETIVGATGTATVNFGGFPGASDTSVLVTGQTGIVAGSLVEAWLVPTATSDHSADEHIADGPRILAGNIVSGTGFTIYAVAQDEEPVPIGVAPMPYGQWSVAWCWN
jgi:hypothetical protein